jgi:hypothetical protein
MEKVMKLHARMISLPLLGLTLVGCQGSAEGPAVASSPIAVASAPSTIGGVAAAGAPLVGTVTLADSNAATAARVVNIGAGGRYTINVDGLTAPFMLKAVGTAGGVPYTLYSTATAGDVNGTVNVTTLTDLICANAAGSRATLEALFNDANVNAAFGFGGTLTQAQIDAAETALQTILQELLDAAGLPRTIDLMNTPFNADHSGLDGIMDFTRISFNPTGFATLTNAFTGTSVQDWLNQMPASGSFGGIDLAAMRAALGDLSEFGNLFQNMGNMYGGSPWAMMSGMAPGSSFTMPENFSPPRDFTQFSSFMTGSGMFAIPDFDMTRLPEALQLQIAAWRASPPTSAPFSSFTVESMSATAAVISVIIAEGGANYRLTFTLSKDATTGRWSIANFTKVLA